MTIESKLHAEGVLEQIKRLRASLQLSAQHLDGSALKLVADQVQHQVAILERATEEYKKKLSSTEWQTLSVSTEAGPAPSRFAKFCLQTLELTAPLRQTAQNLKQKPATSAGFCFGG